MPVLCSLVAVVWQLGALVLLHYGVDPIGLLVPFLIFAIGVSHGVQKISAVGDAAFAGMSSMDAARRTFRQLLVPAIVALLADLVGFVTILLIPVPVIREMAVTASIGVAIVILTDLVLLPVLVSFVHFDAGYHARVERRHRQLQGLWLWLCRRDGARARRCVIIARRRAARCAGPVEGARDSDRRYPGRGAGAAGRTRATTATTTSSPRSSTSGSTCSPRSSQSQQPVCVSHELMTAIERFAWHMSNVPGVQDVITLPFIAKVATAGWNEGSLKWRSIPREQTQLTQSTRYIETSTGLLNENCDVVPVLMFLTDHRAETIARGRGGGEAVARRQSRCRRRACAWRPATSG